MKQAATTPSRKRVAMETEQTKVWKGEFGRAYSQRSTFDNADDFNQQHAARFGMTRDDLFAKLLSFLPRQGRILEVGCNLGYQLSSVGRAGFDRLYGIDIQLDCLETISRERPELLVVGGSGLALPFSDETFDLVMTHHVLIHFSERDLSSVLDEIYRVSRGHVLGIEYYAPKFTSIPYRGNKNLLWKADYAEIYRKRFPNMETVQEEKLIYLDRHGISDSAFLLRKCAQRI